MFRKSTLLAFAASAALGLAMLSSTVASAKPGHGGGHGMHGGHHGGHHGHGHHGRGHRHGHRHRPHWHRRYVRWHRPIWYAPRPVVYSSYSAGPCTCLSKEYTQEGAVLFKDRCTNEMAMNPPAQAPQQTGQIETQQPQSAQYQAQYVQPQPSYPPQAK